MELIVSSPATVNDPEIVVRVVANNSLATDELLLFIGEDTGVPLDLDDTVGTTRYYSKAVTLPPPAVGAMSSTTLLCVRGRRKGYPGEWSEEFFVEYATKMTDPVLTLIGRDINGAEKVITEGMRVFGGDITARVTVDNVPGDEISILNGRDSPPDGIYAYTLPTDVAGLQEVKLLLEEGGRDYQLAAGITRAGTSKFSPVTRFVCRPADPRVVFDTFAWSADDLPDLQDSHHYADVGQNWLMAGRWNGWLSAGEGGYDIVEGGGVVAHDRLGDLAQRWAWNNQTMTPYVNTSIMLDFELGNVTSPIEIGAFAQGAVAYGRAVVAFLLLDGANSKISVYETGSGGSDILDVSVDMSPGRHTLEMRCVNELDYTVFYDGVLIGEFPNVQSLGYRAVGFGFLPQGGLDEIKLIKFTAKETE